MQDIRDMEANAARIAAMTPEERAVYEAQLHAHRVSLGLERSAAIEDVVAERARQVIDEGWTSGHDDEHRDGEMARAASAYAYAAHGDDWFRRNFLGEYHSLKFTTVRELWPWDWSWWKPKDRRRDLVRAGALILAEIERLDRAMARRTDEGNPVTSPRAASNESSEP